LLAEYENWEKANRKRGFIKVKASMYEDNDPEYVEWKEWAEKKADWVDPLVDYEDPILEI
jgi:hypothetical protein